MTNKISEVRRSWAPSLHHEQGAGGCTGREGEHSAERHENLKMPGSTLLVWLDRCAEAKGHDKTEAARQLGVTYGYIAQLRSGIRQVSKISDDFAQSCAQYLGLPRIAVLKAAGRITLEDYTEPTADSREIERALEFIQQDPQWGPSLPQEAFNVSADLQLCLITLYEKATGRVLVSKATDHGELY